MKAWPYYQHWLERVSRSFALCIPQLDVPLRDHVALAYLLFRVLDTVEDAPFADGKLQQRQFERLRTFLHGAPSRSTIDTFVWGFPSGIDEAERALLSQTGDFFEEAYALPWSVREAMFRGLDRMALGMAAYTRRPKPLRLVDVDDVSRYCCFVAGVVGELLTDLWTIDRKVPGPRAPLAYHFGLFLQKVNILKDQAEDEAVGRFYVPDRAELLASLHRDARGALHYLCALPRNDRYRIFCAWSLMLGAAAIAQLDLRPDHPKESRRAETAQLLAKITLIVDDDAALERQLEELLPAWPETASRASLPKPESFEWFRHALAAPLTDAEFAGLGIANRWSR